VDFFGSGSLSRVVRGRIVLQADPFDKLIEGLTGKATEPTTSVLDAVKRPNGNNRLYKARRVVNKYDAEGAKSIRETLRRDGFPTPNLFIIDRTDDPDPFEAHAAAPYVISMGLGFTHTSTTLANAFAGRIFIDPSTDLGDAIAVKGGTFEPNFYEDLCTAPCGEKRPEHLYIFPKGWTRGADWPQGEADLRDYAVIIRATVVDKRGKQQIRFLVGGFTEESTEKAGRYLAERWESLRNPHAVSGWWTWISWFWARGHRAGDFVIVISGKASEKYWGNKEPVFRLTDKDLRNARAGGAAT
jgi:hypothetical protein